MQTVHQNSSPDMFNADSPQDCPSYPHQEPTWKIVLRHAVEVQFGQKAKESLVPLNP